VPAVPHDFKGKFDRVAHVLESRGAARPQVGSLHHPGVQLHHPIQVEASPDAGVEERLVLHQTNRGDDGSQRSAAYLTPTGVAGSLDGRLPVRTLALGDRAGSAVDDERRPDRGYSACR
jgi:hypothetical protein